MYLNHGEAAEGPESSSQTPALLKLHH